MKILMAYSSVTGNTKKLCTGVYENIKSDYEVEVCTVKEAKEKDMAAYELIMVGFWVDKGTANKEARKFINKIENKKVILLGTLGAAPDSEHGHKVMKNMASLTGETVEYLGGFLARGKVDEKLTNRIKFLPLPKNLKDQMYESSINSRPTNEEDIEKATGFVREILDKEMK